MALATQDRVDEASRAYLLMISESTGDLLHEPIRVFYSAYTGSPSARASIFLSQSNELVLAVGDGMHKVAGLISLLTLPEGNII